MRKGTPQGSIVGMQRPRCIIVYCTVPSAAIGKKIAKILLDKRLIACANILGPSRSLYRWKGKIAEARELILLVKTTESKYVNTEKTILSLHPYECPCVVKLRIDGGHEKYLDWIGANC